MMSAKVIGFTAALLFVFLLPLQPAAQPPGTEGYDGELWAPGGSEAMGMPWYAQAEGCPTKKGEHLQGRERGCGAEHWRNRVKFEKQLDQFRMFKLLELLDLKEEQEVDFITAFHTMRRERRRLHEEIVALVDSLAEGLRNKTLSDDKINSLVDRISRRRSQEDVVMQEFLAKARKILTPDQMGRMVVFQERFEYKLLEAVRGFRERQGHPGEGMPRRGKP